MKKRIFSLFLSLVMVFSLLPVTALAASVPSTTSYTSGDCTVKFTKKDTDGNYTVTVTGPGGMEDYDPPKAAPWITDGWAEFTTEIVVDDSVRHLGTNAFYGFTNASFTPATPDQLTWAESFGCTIVHDYTGSKVQYTWSADYSECTASLTCHLGDNYQLKETANSTKVGATYTVTFENPLLGSTSISAGTKLPAGLQLIGGTAGATDYNDTPATVDGTGTNPSVVLEYVADANVVENVKTAVRTAAEAILSGEEKVLAVVEANLYINDGGTLKRVTDAQLSDNIEVLLPYSDAVAGKSYTLYHYNGTGLDDSITAQGVLSGGVKCLQFSYNKFSPFVIVGSVGYNASTAIITFNPNGGTGGPTGPRTATVGSVVTLPVAAPTRDGYTFQGWKSSYAGAILQPKDNFTVLGNTDFIAQWEAVSYTVTFLENGSGVYQMPAAQTIKSGEKATKPADPGCDGYTFGGWYTTAACADANKWDFDTAVTKNTTLYAKWIKNTTYSVTYNKNVTGEVVTGMPDNISGIAAGGSYTISNAEPSRTGYTFQGWDADNDGDVDYTAGGSIASVTADITLKAVWAQDKVTVTYPTQEVDDAATAWAISKHGAQTPIVKDTYETFTVTVAAGYDPTTMIVTANGVPLAVAGISGNVYSYKFKATEDTTIAVSAPSALKYNISLPVGDSFTATLTRVDSTAIDAADQPKTFATIDHNKSYTFTVTAKENYEISAVLVNGIKQSAAAGGSNRGTQVFNVTNVTADQTIQVEMKNIIYYTVTYVIDGSQYLTQQVEKGTSATLITPEARTGYSFSGWYTDSTMTGSTVTGSQTISSNTTYYGKYVAQTVQITYNENKPASASGSVTNMPAATTKTYGIATTLSSTVPTRTGYTFLGWGLAANGAPAYQPGDTFSAELTTDLVLYAIWEQKTVTVTLAPSTGCTAEPAGASTSLVVKYGETFTFKVTVDPAYNATAPTVSCSGRVTASTSDATSPYTYTTSALTADTVISINVTKTVKTVTFKYWDSANTVGTDMTVNGSAVYMTQLVDYNAKATQPAAPVVEGYTFAGWYKDATTTFRFDTAITADTTVYAKMVAIKPEVTIPENGTGWAIAFTDNTGTLSTDTRTHTHAYNADCTFTVTISDGYDASNMQVGANGIARAPISIEGNVYTYVVSGVKVNTTITVVGVVRKTVKITYSANADDDVSNMPGVQTAKSYVTSGTDDNDKIVNIIPSRVGYTFKGWATTPTATTVKYAAADIQAQNAGATSKETADTTLYAIWEANTTSITLAVSDVAVAADTGTGTNAKEYEGQKVTLTATLNTDVSTGSVIFYQSSDGGANWTVINSQNANGSTTYTFEATTGTYSGTDTYKVAYKAESAEGYGSSESSPVSVDRLSTAISWLNSTNVAANTLTIKQGATEVSQMIAGQTYTLYLPRIYALDGRGPLTIDQEYTVTWQYLDGENTWIDYTNSVGEATAQITSEYSGYQFRAVVTPVTGATSDFTKAAKYTTTTGDVDTLVANEYVTSLISDPTPKVVVQTTTTKLAITGADNEAADVVINNGTPFNAGTTPIDAHDAQYEGEKVTLTATVKETSTGTPAVRFGSVEFYQNGTLIATVPVETAGVNMGKASFEATMTAFDGTNSVTDNKDVFTAKYVKNATYDESTTSTASDVYIKSTAIQTPVIKSALAGEVNGVAASATTYGADLTDLKAGVQHTFTLKTDGANTTDTADWSVVALDGRTVAKTDYTIQWLVTTGTNEEQAPNEATLEQFIVENSKSGDKYRVKLTPNKGHMTTGAISKYVVIGTKQDVSVTVTTSDEIASTTEKDAYQLDEVTLTAVVAAKETGATMQPTGTVTFYYSVDNGTHWTKVGETTDLSVVADKVTASIKTTQLPVTAGTNVKQGVKVTAIYHGDSSFFESGTYVDSSKTITKNTNAVLINAEDDITIYSSVVYVNSTVENTVVNKAATDFSHNDGIYISVIDGKLNANETNVTLQLSDVYTLDHDDALSKLAIGTDYTVQWQMLSNAAAYTDYAASTAPWANITGETNVTCALVVEQGAAYRAVITVGPETDINRGSYTKVEQDIAGRQVYYSNVLVARSGNLDLTVTINTSKTEDGFEGIVEGETVTINTFASGATNTTPISELTVTVTKQGETDPVFKQVKTDVNGYTSFDWATTAPGYYTLEVTAVPSNGYAAKTVTRELIVRDNDYSFTVSGDNTTYNGKAQGLTVSVNNMGIENELAQKSVVVYYYSDAARTQMVEPSDAGTYYATIRLQESAYWTEKTEDVTFTITKRQVSVVDLVAQAKVYDGTTAANLQEIVLNDATVNAAGVPAIDTGVLNGDSIYAIGTGKTSSAAAGTVTLTVTGAALKGDDAENYELVGTYAGEAFVIQRNQLKGDIADATYAYTGSSITVPADDIAVIDQQGNDFTDYTVTYYYHNGDGVEKVSAMKALGLYTVVVTPRDTDNYKGGAAQKVYVAAAAVDAAPSTSYSATISITNTVELYGATGNTGVVATATKGTASVQYYVDSAWTATVPTDAGRYLVKATVKNGTVTDTAYGLYTIVKADPALSLSASDANYDSAPQTGSPVLTGGPSGAEVYYTWTGGTIQGVSYTAPTEVGKYVVTAHVNETANYTAHEVSDTYEIKPVTLTITADSYQRHQYGEYPQMTATFSGLATGGVAPDTSLRDVQIQPEFLFSGNNDALDQVGNYTVKPVSALARNYTVEYVGRQFTVTQEDANPELAICGMISNGDGDKTIAYYGDALQLYAYGSQKNNVINNSSIWTWEIKGGNANITSEGLLTFNKGNQDVTVRLTRGTGTQSIYTEITIHVLKQEVKVIVPELDVTYSAASQDYTTSKTLQAVNAKGEQVFANNSNFTIGSNTRTDIGTQVVTGQVADTVVSYQSEIYGGRFTVNDKDVTVTPKAQTVVYGDTLDISDALNSEYTVTGKVGSVDPLTDTAVASVRELYNNLDVANKYEILVTGTENINYNVKYVTAPTAPQVTVTNRPLDVKTGVYANKIGQTSGSLNPVGEHPNDNRLAFSASDLSSFAQITTRMYGEPNQVMGYVLETLIAGDSEADLTALLDWLVKYDFNIAGHASVTYQNHNTAINPAGYDTSIYTIPAANQQIVTGATMMDLVNYAETYDLGTQNIYQRPVKLQCNVTETELPKSTSAANLKNILIQNITADKLSGEGGLATLLKHTVANLDLKVTYKVSTDNGATWTTVSDFGSLAGYNKVKATISVGNPDYYAVPIDVEFNVTPTKYVIEIVNFGQTSASVNLYEYNEDTHAKTLTWFTADKDLAAGSTSAVMTCKIYNRVDDATKYADYAYETPVVNAKMNKGYTTGRYNISYSALYGKFRMFAIADGYIIIDNT